jgi:N-acylneuraminate cytidylyltransferase
MILAVIPARGGSKRIPHKNIREFCGQPIIGYSIQAALNSGVFDRVIVSTDCDKIAGVAKQCGAEVPFTRPAELSDDHTPTIPVIDHAVNWYQERGEAVDYACCIYATSPFVQVADLKMGLSKLTEKPGAEFLFPVTTFPFPIFRALEIKSDKIEMIWPANEVARSQDLPEAYHDAGQFYWGTSKAWTQNEGIYSSHALPLKIPRSRVQDIDTPEDWNRAEMMYKAQRPNIDG